MSKEHQTFNATVKCKNPICGHTHTAILLAFGGQFKKIPCPVCGWHTMQKDLNIIQVYKP